MSKNKGALNIAKKLEENIEIISSKVISTKKLLDGTKGIETHPNLKFLENRTRLFFLLIDHPHFHKYLKNIRRKYKLPETGFSDPADAFSWEHKIKSRHERFVEEIEFVVSDFGISKVYRSSAWQFVYDYILCPKRAENNSISDYPIFSIVRTDEDRDVNKFLIDTNSLYIQVFDWTTKRDIEKALKKITAIKKEQLPFKVSRVGDLARKIWLLSQEGLSDIQIKKEIQKVINNSGSKRIFNYQDVPVYRKRYKDSLNTLRKL